MNNFVKTILGLCFAFCLANSVSAATYTVTKIADTNDGACDADCSLREAMAAAAATADDDTIEFSAFFGTAQTIVLSGTDLIINSNGALVINGTGANLLTVSGNNASRVFTNNTNAKTEIRNLRVTAGTGVSTVSTGRGGGVYNNAGLLTLTNLVVTGNSAANGGGANNAGTATLTIVNCTFSNNTATGAGGALQNFSGNTTNIIGSTFSGNTSNSTGTGGGAMQANGIVNIANSTFSGNSAIGGSGGGIFYNGLGLTMNNVTITANNSTNGAGGLHKSTTTNNAGLRNNLIAGNTSGTSTDVSNVINSLGSNLIGAVGTSTGWIASDILNQTAQIGALANNGGTTQTHALLAGSPAINAGQNCVTDSSCTEGNPPQNLSNDQRGSGFPRLFGTAVDIGAFELNSTVAPRPAAFDFDGDGRSDFTIFRRSNGTWYLNRSTQGLFATQFGLSNDNPVPADFDGDGKTDIAVWRDAQFAYFYILNSSNNTFHAEQFGTSGDIPIVVGDWDGDRKADVAVCRRFPGVAGNPPNVFYYRPSASAGVDFRSIQWGASGDVPVAGDYDGDGKRDAAVFRPSNGIWYILQSSNNQPRYDQWGASTDRAYPADFDGDGKTDLAVYRNGLWAILQSSNNQQRYQQFGQSTDRLVPADYDGDGKTDLAVWRDGVFFVLRSNGNQSEVFQFGAASDIPVASVQFF